MRAHFSKPVAGGRVSFGGPLFIGCGWPCRLDGHGIAFDQFPVQPLAHLQSPCAMPITAKRVAHFRERGRLPPEALGNLHKMHTVTRRNGPLPLVKNEPRQRLGEGLSELLRHLACGNCRTALLKKRDVAERGNVRPFATLEPCEQLRAIASEILSVLVRVEVNLDESEARLRGIFIRVSREIRFQVRVSWFQLHGDVFGDELELLPQTPPNDRIVLPKFERRCFPHGDLLANPVVDQALQLIIRWRALEGSGVGRNKMCNLSLRNDDSALVRTVPRPGRQAIAEEQRGRAKQKMKEWITQKVLHSQSLSYLTCWGCTRSETCMHALARSSSYPSAA